MLPIIFACLVIVGATPTEQKVKTSLEEKAKHQPTRVRKIDSFTNNGHFEKSPKCKRVDEVVIERIHAKQVADLVK